MNDIITIFFICELYLTKDEESEAGVSQEEGVVYPARVQSSFDNLMEMEGKNPISILNEMYPGVQYLLLSSEVSYFIVKI